VNATAAIKLKIDAANLRDCDEIAGIATELETPIAQIAMSKTHICSILRLSHGDNHAITTTVAPTLSTAVSMMTLAARSHFVGHLHSQSGNLHRFASHWHSPVFL
jgi:hypothetical protein